MRAVGLWMRERDIVVLVTHSTNVLNTYYVPGTILGSGDSVMVIEGAEETQILCHCVGFILKI